ncbi:MAG: valine--tRNA ligase, partial [Hyphomicrobiaceae bacterium]|nr:valine--tRNA ligase [Hyphomicrobiaceae bacterium]
ATKEISWVIRLVSEVRSVRSEMNVPPHAKITLELVAPTNSDRERGERHQETIERMARLDHISFVTVASSGTAIIVFDETTAALPLRGVIDMDAERTRLHKEIKRSYSEIAKIKSKFANSGFMAKAPEAIIEENRDRQADFEDQIRRLKTALKRLDISI